MSAAPGRTWLNRQRLPLLIMLGASLIFCALVNGFADQSSYLVRVIVLLGINIILVVALNLSNGFTGVFSLGHVGFMAIGAYVSSILTLTLETKSENLPDLPVWLAHVQFGFLPALLIAGVLAAIVAWLIGIPLMRLSGHYVSVATLGFLVIVHIVLINWTQFTRGARTFSGVLQYTTLWWVYAWLLITIYVVWRVVNSPYGRMLLAVREDSIAAKVVGINILRARLLAFVISAFLTAVGGGADGALSDLILAGHVLLHRYVQLHHHAGDRRDGQHQRLGVGNRGGDAALRGTAERRERNSIGYPEAAAGLRNQPDHPGGGLRANRQPAA